MCLAHRTKARTNIDGTLRLRDYIAGGSSPAGTGATEQPLSIIINKKVGSRYPESHLFASYKKDGRGVDSGRLIRGPEKTGIFHLLSFSLSGASSTAQPQRDKLPGLACFFRGLPIPLLCAERDE
jgi:hypothetical protein